MKKSISRFILHLLGWKAIITVPDFPKCVFCVAPHTSNCDFLLGKLAYLSVGRKAGFLIKKDWFFFPLNLIFKAMGGVPVNRSRRGELIDQVVEQFKTHDQFCIAITPEGTRKRNSHWKKGFYLIAQQAEVPIVLAYIDYQRKVVGIERVFDPSGDYEKDIQEIKSYFKNVVAKFPNQFTTE